MANNREWLKSLSDKQLEDEIKYGRMRAETPINHNHQESAQRDLDEARLEKLAREQDRR